MTARLGDCTICAEESVLLQQRKCCNQSVCQRCLYQHVQSIFEEGRTGGRRKISCPLGCGHDVTDVEIRACFHKEHESLLWNFIGVTIYALLRHTYLYIQPRHRHFLSKHLLQTRGERRDLHSYHQWSLLTAYAEMTKKNDAEIMHCPAADCDYSWIVATPSYRRHKRQHESKGYYFYYSPLPPEPVPTTWVEPDFLNLEVTGWIPQDVEDPRNDGRRMVCGKCAHVFCALCRHPWRFGPHQHRGISCQSYGRKLPRGWDSNDLRSWGQTRSCPGCQIQTSRISGCNHMTCPCGYEWCYVCRAAWNPVHYSCVDGQVVSCVVS